MPQIKRPPIWKVVVGGLIYMLLAGVWLVPFAIPIVVITSPAIAAWGIWKLVRWINRRDDPRYARLPEEPP